MQIIKKKKIDNFGFRYDRKTMEVVEYRKSEIYALSLICSLSQNM
jgi:hypothetical protein